MRQQSGDAAGYKLMSGAMVLTRRLVVTVRREQLLSIDLYNTVAPAFAPIGGTSCTASPLAPGIVMLLQIFHLLFNVFLHSL